MSVVHGDIKPLRKRVIVKSIEKGHQTTKGGIIVLDDDGKDRGIRPRWAQVYRVGEGIASVKEGDYVLIEHGRWGRGIQLDTGKEKFDIRVAEEESILLVSDDKPGEFNG
jgi:co-chaperonin GroES (HSP10)|tara:strand:+ start:9867 stop:10196 length:330 start_codon:yes stop_codon:yes gene_type:complete